MIRNEIKHLPPPPPTFPHQGIWSFENKVFIRDQLSWEERGGSRIGQRKKAELWCRFDNTQDNLTGSLEVSVTCQSKMPRPFYLCLIQTLDVGWPGKGMTLDEAYSHTFSWITHPGEASWYVVRQFSTESHLETDWGSISVSMEVNPPNPHTVKPSDETAAQSINEQQPHEWPWARDTQLSHILLHNP